MVNDLRVALRVEAEMKEARKEIQALRKDVKGMGGSTKAAARDTRQMNAELARSEREMRRTGRQAESLGRALGALFSGVAFGAVIRATVAQEQALAQVEARIKSTGGAAGVTTAELAQMAGELQKVSTFGDEEILQMQSTLLTFRRIGAPVFRETTEVILDMSTALGKDLQSSAIQVGKALEDPVRGVTALRESGIQFTEAQEDLIKSLVASGQQQRAQALILAELKTQFGGAAQAARGTLGGALAALKNAAGDLLENEGGLPALTQEINKLTDALSDPSTQKAADELSTGLFRAFAAILGTAREAGQEIYNLGVDIGLGFNAKETLGEVEFAQGRLERLLRLRDSANPLKRFKLRTGDGEWFKFWDEEELNAEIARLQSIIEQAAQRARDTLSEGMSPTPAPTPTPGAEGAGAGGGLLPSIEADAGRAVAQVRALEASLKRTRALIASQPATPAEELNTLDFATSITRARDAFNAGDLERATAAADGARQIIERMAQAGTQSDLVLSGLTRKLEDLSSQMAAAGAEGEEVHVMARLETGEVLSDYEALRAEFERQNPIVVKGRIEWEDSGTPPAAGLSWDDTAAARGRR